MKKKALSNGVLQKKITTTELVMKELVKQYLKQKKGIINGKLSKRVLQLSLTGELIREWPSTQECGRNGFDQSAVSKCCNGKLPHYKGFCWMYAEDYKEQQFKELGCLPLW